MFYICSIEPKRKSLSRDIKRSRAPWTLHLSILSPLDPIDDAMQIAA